MAIGYKLTDSVYNQEITVFVPEIMEPLATAQRVYNLTYRWFLDFYNPESNVITLFVANDTVKQNLVALDFPSNLIIAMDGLCSNHPDEEIKFYDSDRILYFRVKYNSANDTIDYGYGNDDFGSGSSVSATSTGYGFFSLPAYYLNSANVYPYVQLTDGTAGLYAYGFSTNVFFYEGVEPISTDPYDDAGESDTGGGEGDLDGTSDDIDIPSLPTLSAVDTGFITLFNPTLAQIQSLADYMWNGLFDINNLRKLFNDPMDCILGLSIVPVDVPSGSASSITIGNLLTTVTMNKATSQYVSVDCGTINVNEYWGAFLDYAPHTKAEIFLPYCGTHALEIDDIMGKAVHVVYHVDILSGGCVAYVKCGGSVLYEFNGTCSVQIPITNNDFSSMIQSLVQIGISAGGMLATGGMTAPLTMATVGKAVGAGAQSLAGSAINGGMKPNVSKSGAMSSSIGLLGVQTPYLIVTRPRQCVPGRQNEYTGYPSYITRQLSAISGYTEVLSIHLDGIPATDAELNEIDSLLHSGVII